MAPRKAVNLANLEALGARRLAEILLELGTGDPGVKRRLRLEFSAAAGAEAIAAEIGKRLVRLRQARSFVDWQKRPALVKELNLQRQMIVEKVTDSRPDLALDLLWRFLELAESVLGRVDDSRGDVGDVFRQACRDLGAAAAKASPDPVRFADQVFAAVTTNEYGEHDHLVEAALPALQGPGIARLKGRLTEALAKRPGAKRGFDAAASGLRRALQDIADGEGDVDLFIAHEAGRRSPHGAAAIARRLLAGGRADEALRFLEQGAPADRLTEDLEDAWLCALETGDWDQAWIAALLATERHDEAQRFRWKRFADRLDAAHLRAYLRALPDFEDVVVERRALDHALAFPHFAVALTFLTEWPEHRHAARLVIERHAEIDGNLYFVLGPAAQALEGKQPLAAALLRRAMIEDTLEGAKATRYRHAARHLLECGTLEPIIGDHGGFETHDSFETRLRAHHGRKTGFWSQVTECHG